MVNLKKFPISLKNFIRCLLIVVYVSFSVTPSSASQFKSDVFNSLKVTKKKRVKPSRQCFELRKKRNQPNSKPLFAKQWKPKRNDSGSQAEVDDRTVARNTTPSPKPQPAPKPVPTTKEVAKKAEVKPDAKPIIPAPANDKQALMRKEVEKELATQKDGEPLEVAPLYFVNAQEEFAFMDMEPFLKAVEFAYQGKMILIEGHTDSNGKAEDNLLLSMRRVERIKQLMVDIGISEHQISVIGYGEAEPKYDNNSEEGRQKNRRVDFKVF